jgi:hypothetical protein
MSKQVFAVIGIFGSLGLCIGLMGAVSDDSRVPPDTTARARLDLANRAFETLDKLHMASGHIPKPDEAYRWSRRKLDAEVDLAADRSKRILAFEAHLDRMKKEESRVRELLKDGHRDVMDLMNTEFYRLEAESMLARARSQQ